MNTKNRTDPTIHAFSLTSFALVALTPCATASAQDVSPANSLPEDTVNTSSGSKDGLNFLANSAAAQTGAFFDAGGDRIPPAGTGQGSLAETRSYNLLGKLGYKLDANQNVQLSALAYKASQDTIYTTDPSVPASPLRAYKPRALVRGAWNGTVYLHPVTAEMLGRRGDNEGAVHFLFNLHSRLFVADTGKILLTLAAFAYAVILTTGVYLWWPAHWVRALRMRFDAGSIRLLFDWHRVTGILVVWLVLISVVSGAYMS